MNEWRIRVLKNPPKIKTDDCYSISLYFQGRDQSVSVTINRKEKWCHVHTSNSAAPWPDGADELVNGILKLMNWTPEERKYT